MNLEHRCGELIMGGFDGPQAPRELLQRLSAGHLGGVILFARNIVEPLQVAALCAELRAAAGERRLLIAVDQEGGRVQRLREPPSRHLPAAHRLPQWPPMATLGARDDLELTRAVGRGIGSDLYALGFDVNFAPVLDVVDNADNTVIADRAFGADAEVVTRHGLVLAAGLGDAGIIGCAKHFPGHGGPVADSHHELPHDERPRNALEAQDLLPFIAAARARLPMMMVAHVVYPALLGPDEGAVPATFSPQICTTLARETVGFDGLLCSDDLEMGAIVRHGDVDTAALRGLKAGIDLFLICHEAERQEAARETFVRAVEADAKVSARVGEALRRRDALLAAHRSPERSPAGRAVEALLPLGRHLSVLSRLGSEG